MKKFIERFRIIVDPVRKYSTDCCALCHLTMGNYTPIEDIYAAVNKLKEEAPTENWLGKGKEKGQRAAFTIVTPYERILEENLIEVGFRHIATFDRRNGYPEGKLKMYFYNF